MNRRAPRRAPDIVYVVAGRISQRRHRPDGAGSGTLQPDRMRIGRDSNARSARYPGLNGNLRVRSWPSWSCAWRERTECSTAQLREHGRQVVWTDQWINGSRRSCVREDIVVRGPSLTTNSRTRLEELRKPQNFSGNPMVLHLSAGIVRPEGTSVLEDGRQLPEFHVPTPTRRDLYRQPAQPERVPRFRRGLVAISGRSRKDVQQDLGIEEFTDPHNPMIPHTFVLEPGLQILGSTTVTGTGGDRRCTSCTSICECCKGPPRF